MNFLDNIKNILIVGFLALTVGFFAGFYTKGQFFKASEVTALVVARKDTAVGIQDSLIKSAAIDAEVETVKTEVRFITKTVIQRITEKENATPATCPKFAFDLASASLLNSARTGTPADPASVSDEAGKAATDLGIQGFVENDSAIVAQYRELAKDHDALVDYVTSLINKQAQ